jgi:arylsulfatase A-like enzyme
MLVILLASVVAIGCGGSSGSKEEVIVDPIPTPDPTPDPTPTPDPSSKPNILLIISDDQGLDASAQYSLSVDVPVTPVLNELATQGLTFENVWATPACTTTRATMITGKYGLNSDVTYVPAKLSEEHHVLQQYLKNNQLTAEYQSAVFGKWHLGGGQENPSHPNDVGVDHYAGNLSNLDDYYNWQLTINGESETSTEYHSTKITNLTVDWIQQQSSPWFAWVAYSAPHSPYHLPPESLHSGSLSGEQDDIDNNKRDYYLAAVEAMDAEIGRLLDSLDEVTRENTVIIFIGDNGTPADVIDRSVFAGSHSKGSLYQGGVAVPMVIAGKGVTRVNSRDHSLITVTDLYATIAEIAGIESQQVHDSTSFANLLSDESASSKSYVYTEFESDQTTGWSVRSSTHKLIEYQDGTQEVYLLTDDFAEQDNIVSTVDSTTFIDLDNFAHTIIVHDDESPLDITNAIFTSVSANCQDYVESYTSTVQDLRSNEVFMGDLSITVINGKCVFNTNAIPNHDFNDGFADFANAVSAQDDMFEVTTTPSFTEQATPLSLTVNNAILLNGVKVDLLAGGCYNVGNGKTGCNGDDTPWRYNPIAPNSGYRVDNHNAHAQPDGTYHYHGSPYAMFADDNAVASPVIGFAADGFPIFGSYFENNDSGIIRKALSSYQVKAGARPTGDEVPPGDYDGTYRDDHEYIENSGDLDECNGMTINGIYGYYVSDGYPYVMNCFKGTVDASFNK